MCNGCKTVVVVVVVFHILTECMRVAANKLPDRMRLANDGTELILSEACKECADGSSDLQVIQCNASNVHGYTFGDGYINVLGKKDT